MLAAAGFLAGFVGGVLGTADVPPSADGAGAVSTIRVSMELNTGGSLTGAVVDCNDHGLVIVHDRKPYVFSWDELKSASACAIRRQVLLWRRHGEPLSAEDRMTLGTFALRRGKADVAVEEFQEAIRQDRTLEATVKQRLAEARERSHRRRMASPAPMLSADERDEEETPTGLVDADAASQIPSQSIASFDDMMTTPDAARRRVMEIYEQFGRQVQETLGKYVRRVETDHFLIWTDWAQGDHSRLSESCESMYAALCRQFGVRSEEPVFAAKCPVFCFRSRNRFQRFAKLFDGYDAANSAGYSRSIERGGHVHLALVRFGQSDVDENQFSATLVHEGTHAFLHRFHAPRLIPHWVNEGLAEMMAERVLGERSPAGENAQLLAQQYVRYDWSIGDLLAGVAPIDTHQYAVAHSVVAFLDAQNPGQLVGFVRDLKDGKTVADALSEQFGGMTLHTLEATWREWVRSGL